MAGPSEKQPLVLVTGLAGFTGPHLIAALEARGWRVVGLDRQDSVVGSTRVYACDLLDREGLFRLIDEHSPQGVIHMAGISAVHHENIDEIYRTNIMGTRNLLESLVRIASRPQAVLLASSANVYGNTGGRALDESTPPAPANDYAVSKLAMEFMARTFAEKLPITIIRPFNYTGRGQTTRFVVPKIVEHFRQKASVIELGNLDVTREFSDVRRTVEAYARLLALPGTCEIYNICSGKGESLRQILSEAEKITGHRIEVRVNPAFVRENEVEILIGSCDKLEAAVGVLPRYAIKDTLSWMLEG